MHVQSSWHNGAKFGDHVEFRTSADVPGPDDACEGLVMPWIVLVVSGLLETVWAVALAESEGFRHPVPTGVFAVGLLLSMSGLAYALRTIPVGTGYAVWVGIGAVGTAIWGITTQGDAASFARIACLVAVVAGVVGLKFTH